VNIIEIAAETFEKKIIEYKVRKFFQCLGGQSRSPMQSATKWMCGLLGGLMVRMLAPGREVDRISKGEVIERRKPKKGEGTEDIGVVVQQVDPLLLYTCACDWP
jgi:hypothetical protein